MLSNTLPGRHAPYTATPAMMRAPTRNSIRAASSAFLLSSISLITPPMKSAAIVGIDTKTFHTALTWPDIACCWPSTEVSPCWALETNRNDVVSSTMAASSVP
jgi:hypothetical protein